MNNAITAKKKLGVYFFFSGQLAIILSFSPWLPSFFSISLLLNRSLSLFISLSFYLSSLLFSLTISPPSLSLTIHLFYYHLFFLALAFSIRLYHLQCIMSKACGMKLQISFSNCCSSWRPIIVREDSAWGTPLPFLYTSRGNEWENDDSKRWRKIRQRENRPWATREMTRVRKLVYEKYFFPVAMKSRSTYFTLWIRHGQGGFLPGAKWENVGRGVHHSKASGTDRAKWDGKITDEHELWKSWEMRRFRRI